MIRNTRPDEIVFTPKVDGIVPSNRGIHFQESENVYGRAGTFVFENKSFSCTGNTVLTAVGQLASDGARLRITVKKRNNGQNHQGAPYKSFYIIDTQF